MSTNCPIPPSAKAAITKIAGNILTFQKDGVLHIHDFYDAVGAYKNSKVTPGQEYILKQALLEAEKIYYTESNGARLEVIGTRLVEGKNGTNFKRENMKIERERSAEPVETEPVQSDAPPKKPTKQTTKKQRTAAQSTQSVLGEMRQAPWAKWLGAQVGGVNAVLTKYASTLVPKDIKSYKFDIFRGKDIDGHLEGIDSIETQDEFVEMLNYHDSENKTYFDSNGNEHIYGDKGTNEVEYETEVAYEVEVDGKTVTKMRKETVKETKTTGKDKVDATWSTKTKDENEEAYDYKGESFFTQYGLFNVFRNPVAERISDFAKVMADNWTGKSHESLIPELEGAITFLTKSGYLDRFSTAMQNYTMGGTSDANMLQLMAVKTDEYAKGEKPVNPDKNKSKTNDVGSLFTLPTIVTDTMFAILPAVIEDAITSKQDTMRRELEDGNMSEKKADEINNAAPAVSDMAERIGKATLDALGIKLTIMKEDPDNSKKKIRDYAAEARFTSTLGLTAIMAARDIGILNIEKEKTTEIESIDVVRMNIYKNNSKDIDEAKEILISNLVSLSAAVARGLVPNQKLLPSTESNKQKTITMKRTNLTATKDKIRAINEVLNKTKYVIDFDFMKHLSGQGQKNDPTSKSKGLSFADKDGMSRQDILKTMGFIDIDKAHDNIDTVKTKEAHNKALEEELDNFNEFAEDVYKLAASIGQDGSVTTVKDIELFMDYFIARNGRMNNDQTIGNVIQQKHYVRQMMSFKDPAYVNWKDDTNVMAFYRTMLQNMGNKIEKNSRYTPHELYTQLKEIYNDTSSIDSNDALAEWANSHEGFMSIKALFELKEIMPLLEIVNDKKASKKDVSDAQAKLDAYTTRVNIEVDGITNGFGLSTLQYGATDISEFKKFANRVGLFLRGQSETSYADYTGLDGYEGLDANVKDGLAADAKKDKKMYNLQFIFGKRPKNQKEEDKDKTVHLGVFGRLLAKDPLMVFFYGAGKYTISHNVGRIMWEKQLASVSANKDNPAKAAFAMRGIIQVYKDMGITQIPKTDWLSKKSGKYYPSNNANENISLEKFFMNPDGTVNWNNFSKFSFEGKRYRDSGRKTMVWTPVYGFDASYKDGPIKDEKTGKIKKDLYSFEDAIINYYAHNIGKRYYEGAEKEYGFFGKNTERISKASFIIGEVSELLLGDENLQEVLESLSPKERNAITKRLQASVVTYGSKEETALVSKILSEKRIIDHNVDGSRKQDASGKDKTKPVSKNRISRAKNNNTGESKTSVASRTRDKAALKSGPPSLTHHLDAAVMAKALLLAAKRLRAMGFEVKATQIYDAVITQHDQSGEFARAYNEAMMDIMKEYSITAEVTKALIEKYKFVTEYDSGLGQLLDDIGVRLQPQTVKRLEDMMNKERDGSEGALDVNDRTQLKDNPNLLNIVAPFAEELINMIEHHNKQEKMKVELYAELESINQVSDGSQDSIFTIKESIVYEPKIIEFSELIEEQNDNFSEPVSVDDVNIEEAMGQLDIDKDNAFGVLKAMAKHFRHIKFDFTTSRTNENMSLEDQAGSWDSGKGILFVNNMLAPFKAQATLIHETGHMITVDWIEKHPKSKEVKALVKWMGNNIEQLLESIENSDTLTDREKYIFKSKMDYITRHADRTTMVAELMAIVIAEKDFRRVFAIGAKAVDSGTKTKTTKGRILRVIKKLAEMIVNDGHPMLKYLYSYDTKHNDMSPVDMASEGYGLTMIVLNKSFASNVARKSIKSTATGKYYAPSNGAPNATQTNMNIPGEDIEPNIFKRHAIVAGYHKPDLEFSTRYNEINSIPLNEHKNVLMYSELAVGHVWGIAVDVPLNTADSSVKHLINKTWESAWVSGKRASAYDYYIQEQYKGHPIMEPLLGNFKKLMSTNKAQEWKNFALGIPKDIREVFNEYLTSKDTIEKNYVREKDRAYNRLKKAIEKSDLSEDQTKALVEFMMASNAYMMFDKGPLEAQFWEIYNGTRDLDAMASGAMSGAVWYATDSDMLNDMVNMIEGTSDALAKGTHNNYEVNNGLQAAIAIGLPIEKHDEFATMFDLAVTYQAMKKNGGLDTIKTVPAYIVKIVGENSVISHNVSTALFEADVANLSAADGTKSTIVKIGETKRHHRLGYYKELYDGNLESKFINFSDSEYNIGKLREEGWNIDDAKETIGGVFITRRNLRSNFKKGIVEQEGDQGRGTEIKDIADLIRSVENDMNTKEWATEENDYQSGYRAKEDKDYNRNVLQAISKKYGDKAVMIYDDSGKIVSAKYIMSRAEKKDILGLNTTDVARVSADTLATSNRKVSAKLHNQSIRENLVASFFPDVEEPRLSIMAMEKLFTAYSSGPGAVDNDIDTVIADNYVEEYIAHVADKNPLMLGEMAGFPLENILRKYNNYHKNEPGFVPSKLLEDYKYVSSDIPIPPQFKNEGVKYIRKGMENTAMGYHQWFLTKEDWRILRRMEHQFYGAANVIKQNVVSKMPETQGFNVASNVYILKVHGVSWSKIRKGFMGINKDISKIELETDKIVKMKQNAMKYPKGSNKRTSLLSKATTYEQRFKDSELYSMVAYGFIQSLTDEISSEIPKENNVFMQDMEKLFSVMMPSDQKAVMKTVLAKMEKEGDMELEGFHEHSAFISTTIMEMIGHVANETNKVANIDGVLNPLSGDSAKKFTQTMSNYFKKKIERGETTPEQIIKEIFLAEGSVIGSSANRFMQQADYAARKTLFEDMWEKEQKKWKLHRRYVARNMPIPYELTKLKTKDEIKAYARDMFVDYRVNLPAEFDWLSRSMIWKFVTFSVGIQRALIKMAYEHPVRSIVHAVGFDELGLGGAITYNSLLSPDLLSAQVDEPGMSFEDFVPGYMRVWN